MIEEFPLKTAPTKPNGFNAIDNRDLADVYLSSTFNEPCSNDVANLVKRFVSEGSIQTKTLTRPPLKPSTDPSAVVPSTVIDAGIDEQLDDLCASIGSFSLDSKSSTLWRMRRAVLNKIHDAIKEDSVEGTKIATTTTDKKTKGRVWDIAPVVFNPTVTCTKHSHVLSLNSERRR